MIEVLLVSDLLHFLFSDDNSNQSSIADSSPLKQETSNTTSPTPEPLAASQSDSNEAKSDQFPSKQSLSGQDSKTGETDVLFILKAIFFHHPNVGNPQRNS